MSEFVCAVFLSSALACQQNKQLVEQDIPGNNQAEVSQCQNFTKKRKKLDSLQGNTLQKNKQINKQAEHQSATLYQQKIGCPNTRATKCQGSHIATKCQETLKAMWLS